MGKKRKGVVAAAAAFAASPQGRRALQQAKEYAQRPETKAKARDLIAQARSRSKGGSGTATPRPAADTTPTYGSPPVR
jgi:hypothetical protein